MFDDLEDCINRLSVDLPHDSSTRLMLQRIPDLFEKIRHGEPGHEAWLKQAIKAHFLDLPMPEYFAK